MTAQKARLVNYLFSSLFFLTLSSFLISHLLGFGSKQGAITENRKLNNLPALSTTPLLKIPQELDKYLEDSFPFRDIIIRQANLLRSLWLKRPSENVIVGKDNWLFYKGDDIFADLIGKKAFRSQSEIREWFTNYVEKQNWLQDKGARYCLLVVPNKSSLHKERLPWWLKSRVSKRRMQQLTDFNDRRNLITLIDLTQKLESLKEKGIQSYWSNDTHWSGHSLLVAIETLHAFSRAAQPNGPKHEFAEFFSIRTDYESGDLSSLLGLASEWPVARREKLFVTPPPDMSIRVAENLLSLDTFKNLSKDHHSIPMEIYRASGQGTALVFHDSFFATAESDELVGKYPFALSYRKCIAIWMRPTVEELKSISEIVKPDIVIEERVERLLYEGNMK